MYTLFNFFLTKLGSLFSFLGSVYIVSGVSILHFLAALFILMLVIHNVLLRAR